MPRKADRILATTGKAELVEIALDGHNTPVAGAPKLVWIDTTPGGLLVGVAPRGEVYAADETTGEWDQLGTVPGQPSALDATENIWHISTDAGIYASRTAGRPGPRWSKPSTEPRHQSPRSRLVLVARPSAG